MDEHQTRGLERTFPPPPVAKNHDAGTLNDKTLVWRLLFLDAYRHHQLYVCHFKR